MKIIIITLMLVLMTMITPVVATVPNEVENEIPVLIERFITAQTRHGVPRSYTWVIEKMMMDQESRILVTLRVVSASIDRKTLDDERFLLVFITRDFAPMSGLNPGQHRATIFSGYSKLPNALIPCEETHKP